ncbi:MAG: trigger factor [Clostridiaceae bacterium]|jgi:trigger factor|nr:trigger factor [Clostridiaceae bacterium]
MPSKKVSEDNRTAVLTVEVTPDEFKQSLQAAHRKNANHFQVPGFRKGRAPYPIVVRHYGESMLYDDALEFALPKAYQEALAEQEIAPFSDPRFDVKEIGGDVGLVFEVSVALKPEVTLGVYEGVEAYRPPVEVDDEDVDEKIEAARERVSRLVPVTDRPAKDGDKVMLDYEGFLDGVAFEGGAATGHELEIGSDSFIPGFEDGLIGHNTGDEFDLPLTFPEEYHADDLAGKDVIFHVKIHDIHVKELPAVDDEFVRDVSETADTLAEYREEIRNDLSKEKSEQAASAFEQNIIDVIVANSQIELSDLIVEDEVDNAMERQQQQFSMYGLNFSDFLKYSGKTIHDYRTEQAKKSRKLIESAWVIETIREKEIERFEVSEEEFNEALQETAEKNGVSVEVFREQYLKTEHDLEHFRHDQEGKKLLDWLREVSVVTDVPPEPEEEQENDED